MKLSNNPQLLRQIIISHYDNPNNKIISTEGLDSTYISFHNKSASCIDDLEVFVKIENDEIIDVKFSGIGCAISTASTDIFCDLLKNKKIEYAKEILENYFKMINNASYNGELLDELIAFNQIYKQENRIKCALIGHAAILGIINEKK